MLPTWTQPADTARQSMDAVVYAYGFSLCEIDVDTEDCQLVSSLTARVVPVYGNTLPPAPSDSSQVGVAAGVYTLRTGLSPLSPARYTLQVFTVNVDYGRSKSVYADSLAPPAYVRVGGTAGGLLSITWGAADPGTGVDEYVYTIALLVDGQWVDQPGFTYVVHSTAPAALLVTVGNLVAGSVYRVAVQSRNVATSHLSAAFTTSHTVGKD